MQRAPHLFFCNSINGRARNNSTTNLQHRNARAQHLDMSRCWDVANFCPLVVTLLYNNKLSVAGKITLYNKFSRLRTCCTTSTTCCELVRWWCPLVVLYNVSVAGVRVAEFGSNRMAIQTPDCSCLAKATSTAMSKSDRLLTTILPHHDLLSSCSTPLLIRPHSARYYILAFRTRQDVDRATGC